MTSRPTVAVFMGTRPEGIKMAPVVAALRAAGDLDCRVVATGQHREMFQQVADNFGFTVDADLSVMRPAHGGRRAAGARSTPRRSPSKSCSTSRRCRLGTNGRALVPPTHAARAA